MLRNFAIDAAVDISASANGTAVAVDKAKFGFAVQCVVSAGSSPVGTLKLQLSLDQGTPSNWADVADTVTAITANGTFLFQLPGFQHATFVRTVYTRTSGSATLDTRFNENA